MRASLLASIGLLLLTGMTYARELKVTGQNKKVYSSIVPAGKWCSPVVSAELRGTKADILADPAYSQKLIFGAQITAVEDCPQVEYVRIRGVDKGKSLFVAYLEKADNWQNIMIVEGEPDVLSMLRTDGSKEENVRKIALLETKTHMARIGLQDVVYETEIKDKEDVRQNWKLGEIGGSSFVVFNPIERFGSLTKMADEYANAVIEECPQSSDLLTNSLKTGIEIRSLVCKKDDQEQMKVLIAFQSGNLGKIFITESSNQEKLTELNRLMADGTVIY